MVTASIWSGFLRSRARSWDVRLQPRLHTVTASIRYSYSLKYIWLQPRFGVSSYAAGLLGHTVTAPGTLQPLLHSYAVHRRCAATVRSDMHTCTRMLCGCTCALPHQYISTCIGTSATRLVTQQRIVLQLPPHVVPAVPEGQRLDHAGTETVPRRVHAVRHLTSSSSASTYLVCYCPLQGLLRSIKPH